MGPVHCIDGWSGGARPPCRRSEKMACVPFARGAVIYAFVHLHRSFIFCLYHACVYNIFLID